MVLLALPPADHLLIERDRGQFVPSRRRRVMANVRAERLLKTPAEPSPELRIPALQLKREWLRTNPSMQCRRHDCAERSSSPATVVAFSWPCILPRWSARHRCLILAYSPRDKRLVNQWAADHTTTIARGRPVLVLDMYEHAYHMDYGAKAASYVDAFMEAIRWDNALSLYERYNRET